MEDPPGPPAVILPRHPMVPHRAYFLRNFDRAEGRRSPITKIGQWLWFAQTVPFAHVGQSLSLIHI
eukprot:6253376-Alexandrium_andersonii.AAC.1